MPSTTSFLIGRNITCVVTPYAVGAGGVLTAQTALSFVKKLDLASWSHGDRLDQITPLDSEIENNVDIYSTAGMELSEILNNDSAANNKIANALAAGYKHFGVVFTLGSAGTRTYFGIRESYEERYEHGGVRGVLRLRPAIYNA